MAARPLGSSVCLLALLCAVFPCALANDAGTGTNDALDDLLALVNRAVREAVDPISAELRSQRELLSDILGRLSSQDAQAESASARLDAVQAMFDSQTKSTNARLDSIQEAIESQFQLVTARLDSMQDALESQSLSVNARLDSTQKTLESQLQPVTSQLDSMQAELGSQFTSSNSSLRHLQSELDTALDSVTTGLDSVTTRLDSFTTGLDSITTGLDSVTTQLDSFGTRLEKLAEIQQNATTGPRDCSELPSGSPSGVYTLRLGHGRTNPVEAFCDMETDGGGWTVFQRREDILPREDFYRNWTEYKDGFGDLTGEFWWGLEKLWLLTGTPGRRYELRVDLGDFDGEKRYARYENFRISSEFDGYRITGGKYTGNSGDSMKYHFGQKFSTRDKDQDKYSGKNCAQLRESGWWFGSCHYVNLNGVHLSGENNDSNWRGVVWEAWRGYRYSLKNTEMKIRPQAAKVG
ncbi:angiopoietin-related protein 7-like [Amphibalanus amphitrite]|uniref:angiopoietin-related protein 7-like n=1 Tax=Amphibalanus amphitrite TaxID=1232801 RepID=UPI001C90C09C|nr:angiopoietin-related protein 7-like [Amphibalanus amphitrite]